MFCHSPTLFCTGWKRYRLVDQVIIMRLRRETTQFIGKGSRQITEMILRGYEIKDEELAGGMTALTEEDLACLNTCNLYELFLDQEEEC